MIHPKPTMYVGQYKIMARRLAPHDWKVFVFDMDVPHPGGRFIYSSEGWRTVPDAIADGQKRVHEWDELARFRGRWRETYGGRRGVPDVYIGQYRIVRHRLGAGDWIASIWDDDVAESEGQLVVSVGDRTLDAAMASARDWLRKEERRAALHRLNRYARAYVKVGDTEFFLPGDQSPPTVMLRPFLMQTFRIE